MPAYQDGAPAEQAAAATARELRALVGTLRRRLREEAPSGEFTPSQSSVLGRLHSQGPSTLTALAKAEGMRPQSMGAIMTALEAAGATVAAPDPSDGRQTIWSLSDAIQETIYAGRIAKEGWLFNAIRTTLTAQEQEQLDTGIELLKRLVDS